MTEVGGFDERLCGYEDDDLFLRMFCARWRNVYIPKSLSFWRMNNSSASFSPRMAKSRMIYARKLIESFPDDPHWRINFARDWIAPKFFRLSASDFWRAVHDKKDEIARDFLCDMTEMTPYMRTMIRIAFALAIPFLRYGFIARAALGAKPYLRPIARRLLSAL